jgi:hypothetical protein
LFFAMNFVLKSLPVKMFFDKTVFSKKKIV